MSKPVWVRNGDEVRGPFSVVEIRRLAAEGKLTPRHEISSDQQRWQFARNVKGLVFPSASPIQQSPADPAVRVVPSVEGEIDPPMPVELWLDPDDLERSEESLGELLEQEVRRSVPGVLVSVGMHVVLLLALFLSRRQLPSEEVAALQFGWISPAEQTAVDLESAEQRPVELRAVQINQQAPPQPVEKRLAPVKPGAGPAVPVKPVEVGGLFEGRTEDRRRQILEHVENNQRIEQAISQGLGWFQRHQLSDGRWQLHEGYPDPAEPVLRTDTGATALALLAFLGHGQTHVGAKDKTTQAVVQNGLDWLKGIQKENGDFHDHAELGRQTAYYAHSQATIALCEAYALTKDRSLYGPAQRGVEFLLRSQQPNEGGWKYQPQDARSVGDLSVTGWALMALHSARAAGLDVPEEPFQRASKFLNSVQEKNGALYKYEPRPEWNVTRAMTAEGLLCRQFLGWPRNHPALREGVEFLLDPAHQPQWSMGRRNVYEWYYTGHVLHNLNDEDWVAWYDQVQREIIENQIKVGAGGNREKDVRGSWHPKNPVGAPYEHADKAGRLYVTALSLLILEMPYRHQPIHHD